MKQKTQTGFNPRYLFVAFGIWFVLYIFFRLWLLAIGSKMDEWNGFFLMIPVLAVYPLAAIGEVFRGDLEALPGLLISPTILIPLIYLLVKMLDEYLDRVSISRQK